MPDTAPNRLHWLHCV